MMDKERLGGENSRENAVGKMASLPDDAQVVARSGSAWRGVSVQRCHLSPLECRPRAADYYSLVLQISGPVMVEWTQRGGFQKRQMNPDDISVHSIGEVPGFRLHQPVEVLEITLTVPFVMQTFRAVANFAAEFPSAYGIADPQIQRIGRAMQAEAEAGCPGGALLGESLATALTAHLLSRFAPATKQIAASEGGLSQTDLRRVLAFIYENLDQNPTLAALASVTNLSPHHFALRFRQSLGISPHQFVLAQRVERAAQLLNADKDSLAAIARAVGFSSQSHFNLHFKRVKGVTPHQYRHTPGKPARA